MSDMRSARNERAMARRIVLQSTEVATCGSLRAAAKPIAMRAYYTHGMLMGEQSVWPRPALEEVHAAAELYMQYSSAYYIAAKLAEDPSLANILHTKSR